MVAQSTSRKAVKAAVDSYREAGVLFAAHLDLLFQCDLDCQHCYLDDKGSHNQSTAFWKDVIDQLAEMNVVVLILSGGELFLRPDALELIHYASDRGFVLNLKTHAGRLTEAMIAELAECRIGLVEVSFYSHRPEIHDAITRREGSHTDTLDAMKRMAQAGIPTRASFVIMEANQHDVDATGALCAEHGIQFQASGHLFPAKGGGEFPLDLRADEDVRIELSARSTESHGLAGCSSPLADLWAESRLCGAGHSSLYVDPTGKVTPCLMWPLELGDLTRGERISSLWRESAGLDEIRGYRNRDRETCGGCEHRTLCEYCPGLSYQQHEDGLEGADATCDTTYVRAKTNAIAGGVQTPVPLPAGLAKKPFRILNR